MRLALFVTAIALSGCSLFMHSIERPTAQVRDASLTAAGLGGVSGQLKLDVTNPNTFGVPLSGIDWQIAIGGARAATGTVELQQTIPARGVAPVATSLAHRDRGRDQRRRCDRRRRARVPARRDAALLDERRPARRQRALHRRDLGRARELLSYCAERTQLATRCMYLVQFQ